MGGIFDNLFLPGSTATGPLGDFSNPLFPAPTPRAGLASALLSLPPAPPTGLGDILSLLGDPYRRRTEWNDRFVHWEKPASVSEAGTIERAQSNVLAAIASNRWLSDQRVVIQPQGSYHNNTNVRTEADIDLRAVHPALKIEYDGNVHQETARAILAYSDYGLTFQQIFTRLRAELMTELSLQFGRSNVTPGRKAIRIKGITGSRAEVDVVPTIGLHHVTWLPAVARYKTLEGVVILSTDGGWTPNFPEQHAANGVAKRARTAHRFKKVVRIFKRMRADMTARGLLTVSVPSFLVECLVYAVEDAYFLVESDDRYDRVQRIARRMQALLGASQNAARMTEINEIKWLLRPTQAWSFDAALTFANAVVAHLGDA